MSEEDEPLWKRYRLTLTLSDLDASPLRRGVREFSYQSYHETMEPILTVARFNSIEEMFSGKAKDLTTPVKQFRLVLTQRGAVQLVAIQPMIDDPVTEMHRLMVEFNAGHDGW